MVSNLDTVIHRYYYVFFIEPLSLWHGFFIFQICYFDQDFKEKTESMCCLPNV